MAFGEVVDEGDGPIAVEAVADSDGLQSRCHVPVWGSGTSLATMPNDSDSMSPLVNM